MLLLVEHDKRGHTCSRLAQQVATELRDCCVFHNNVVQATACRCDSNVILVLNGAQISQTAMDAHNLARLFRIHKHLEHSTCRLARLLRTFRVLKLATHFVDAVTQRRLFFTERRQLSLGIFGLLLSLGKQRVLLLECLVLFLALGFGILEQLLCVGKCLLSLGSLAHDQLNLTLDQIAVALCLIACLGPRHQLLLRFVELGTQRLRLFLGGLIHFVKHLVLSGDELLHLCDRGLSFDDGLLLLGDGFLCLFSLFLFLNNCLLKLFILGFQVLNILFKLDILALKHRKLCFCLVHFSRHGLIPIFLFRVLTRDAFHLLAHLSKLLLLLRQLLFEFRLLFGLLAQLLARVLEVQLIKSSLFGDELPLLCHELLRLLLGTAEIATLLFHDFQLVHLLPALFIQHIHLLARLLDLLNELVGANDILEILEHASFVFITRLRRHERDELNLALQNEEPVVIEVDARLFEQVSHLFVVAAAAVDVILVRVVRKSRPGHLEFTSLDDVVILAIFVLVLDLDKVH
mmetsp:Transcript_42415/g.62376  ORF Transcript_42415/g.62376 Transcript_42415/m.62376 type:complete len:518 (+) Transcript_42415:2399-3952(+)